VDDEKHSATTWVNGITCLTHRLIAGIFATRGTKTTTSTDTAILKKSSTLSKP
jgi:hypothetical protein